MFKVFKTPINVYTPDGYKTAYGIRKIKKPAIRIEFSNGYIETSLNHKFVNRVDNKDIILVAKDLQPGDVLQNNDSKTKIIRITNIGEIDVYDLIDVDGHIYYTNDLISHNCAFLGSSDTLISGEALMECERTVKETKLIKNTILNELEMYHKVQENNSYILSVDPSKDGIDDFSINVIDVTAFPFVQVATANLQVDYIIMPEHLNELGLYYNEALIIVENNEGSGASITDTLWRVYEYPNLYRDVNTEGRKGVKKYTGFRTTTKSRPLIINLMKIFIEEGKLIIHSQETLNQLYTFTKAKNGSKYQAEDGFKDDAVMSLAIAFAPFMNNRTFDDYELFMSELRIEDSKANTGEFLSALDLGFSNEVTDFKEQLALEMRLELMEEGIGDYSFS